MLHQAIHCLFIQFPQAWLGFKKILKIQTADVGLKMQGRQHLHIRAFCMRHQKNSQDFWPLEFWIDSIIYTKRLLRRKRATKRNEQILYRWNHLTLSDDWQSYICRRYHP